MFLKCTLHPKLIWIITITQFVLLLFKHISSYLGKHFIDNLIPEARENGMCAMCSVCVLQEKKALCIFPSSAIGHQGDTASTEASKSIWSGEGLSAINTKTMPQVISGELSPKLYLDYDRTALWENGTDWKRMIHFAHSACTKAFCKNGPWIHSSMDAPASSSALDRSDFHAAGKSLALCDSQCMSQAAWGNRDW